MKGKIVLITGATEGIGKQTALELSQKGAHIILHGRNSKKINETVDYIKSNMNDAKLDTIQADLSSFSQTRKMARVLHEKYEKIDVLLQNAGVQMHDKIITEDGYETTFHVNHLAYFLLTSLLLDLVANSDYKRIILVASGMHADKFDFNNLQGEREFSLYPVYAQSKLCNILFGYQLASRVKNHGITVNSLHPGLIDTNLNPKRSPEVVARALPVEQGAISTVYLASSSEVDGITGKYYNHLAEEVKSKPVSYNEEYQIQLWKLSEELIGEKFKDLS